MRQSKVVPNVAHFRSLKMSAFGRGCRLGAYRAKKTPLRGPGISHLCIHRRASDSARRQRLRDAKIDGKQ